MAARAVQSLGDAAVAETIAHGGISDPVNSKLGVLIHAWSVPAAETCPGKSNLCWRRCYALRGHFVRPNVRKFLARNLAFARTPQFVPWMRTELYRRYVRVLRIHAAGDFDTPAYIADWQQIITNSPRVTFFGYTRSWRVSWLLPALASLAQLPNMQLWFSIDRETGPAPLIPNVRRAYLAVNDLDARHAPDDCDLIFRDRIRSPMKKSNAVLVCPAENGITGKHVHTCTTCGLCWRRTPARWQTLLPELASNITPTEIVAPEKNHACHFTKTR